MLTAGGQQVYIAASAAVKAMPVFAAQSAILHRQGCTAYGTLPDDFIHRQPDRRLPMYALTIPGTAPAAFLQAPAPSQSLCDNAHSR